jgi:hypothetical protein
MDRLELEIDELIMHGFTGADGPLIKAAVERELAAQFAAKGIPPAMTGNLEVANLRHEIKQDVRAADSQATGEQLGTAVYGVLEK